MCRAVLIKNIKNEENENIFSIVANYAVNSLNAGNRDGFYFKAGKLEIRTLSFSEYWDFLQKHKDEINSSSLIQMHFRAATHGKGLNWVHGWKLGDYNCYHNGVTEIKDKTIENDSFDFFKEVTTIKGDIKEQLYYSLVNRTGFGAFFMVKDNEEGFIFSKSTKINMHLINRNLMIINSNDDIHKFKKNLSFAKEEEIKEWGLAFVGNERVRLKLSSPKITEDLLLNLSDGIVCFDKNGVNKYEEWTFPYNSQFKEAYKDLDDWSKWDKDNYVGLDR